MFIIFGPLITARRADPSLTDFQNFPESEQLCKVLEDLKIAAEIGDFYFANLS